MNTYRLAAVAGLAIAMLLTASNGAAAPDDILLGDAVELTEVARTGKTIDIDAGLHLRAVDLRSRVDVNFDRGRLSQAAARHSSLSQELPPEDPAMARRRLNASRMLNALQAYLDSWRTLDRDIGALRVLEDAGDDVTDAMIADLENRTRHLARTRLEWLDLAGAWSLEKARMNGWSVAEDDDGEFEDERTAALVDLDERALLPDDGRLFDPQVLAGILNDQFDLISEDMKATLARLDENRVVVSVRAFLLRPGAERPLRMHVQNYDDLASPVGPREKSILGLTKSSIDELKRRYEVTEEFARFANDLRREDSDLHEALAQTTRSLGEILRGLDDDLAALFPPTMSQDFLDEVNAVLAADGLNAEEQEALARITDAWTQTRSLRGGIRDLIDRLQIDPQAVFGNFKSLKTELKQRQAEVTRIVSVIGNLPADLETLSTQIQAIAENQASAMAQRARAVAGGLNADFVAAMTPAVAAIEEYELVTAELTAVLAGTAARIDNAGMSEALDDFEAIRPRPLDSVIPGSIFIRDYGSKHRDEIRIVVEFLAPDGDDYRPLEAAEFRLSVRRFGGFSTLDASLIFVERIDKPDGAVTDSFLASPALSLTAHYRKRQDAEGTHGWAGVWNTLNPGLGVNVAALSFDGRSGQYGIGFQATLFGDILQAGYGWNLNVGTNREYWFVGVGLVDALNLASATVGSLTR